MLRNESLLSYLKEFHGLIMQPGLDIKAFLELIGNIFNSQDVCIIQLNEKDMVLKTIFSNPKTPPIKDIILQKDDIFSVIRHDGIFRSFSQTGGTDCVYPEVLIKRY